MTGLKRRASDTLLPLRAPKQRRTTFNHPLGGNSSPSQDVALVARWGRLWMEFRQVVRDTVSSVLPFWKSTTPHPASAPPDPQPVSTERRQVPSPSPSPPPVAPPPPAASTGHRLPPRRPIPEFSKGHDASKPRNQSVNASPVLHATRQRVQSGPEIGRTGRPYLKAYSNMQSNAAASTSTNTLSGPQEPKVSALPGDAHSTGLISPPSTQDSSSSIRSAVEQTWPEVREALKQVPVRRKRSVKRYIEREHIHAKAHKARVREETRRNLEEMERDMRKLYNIRRSAGYGSDYQSFQSLIDYQARLEKLNQSGALAPSPSLVDLHSRARQEENRRHSFPDHVDPDFLQRAIQKAQDALKGPKPPKPFVPTLDQLRLSRRAKDEEIEERLRPKPKPLPASLPPEEDAEVDQLFRRRGVIAKCVKEQVSHEDIVRLQPKQWLNDEIINFYGQMILSRAEESKENPGPGQKGLKKPLNAHYFSTFFWSKLTGQGYQKARLGKWTKKIDIFSKDVLLIPVNHNNSHWTAAAINFRKKRIESYDSMNVYHRTVFKHLRQYLDEEHRDKKKKPFDFTDWQDYVFPNTPQQENGYDCGVFTCQFLESLSRGEEDFAFTQANMPYLRRKMLWEIAHSKLKDES